jgi:iron complex transport system substrate-binding protein
MRIVSLVPSATETLFALGLGDQLVGVTHECDYPPQARELRPVTVDRLSAGLSAAEIDAAVRERTLNGEAIYELDEEEIEELEPDLIVTQALCPVCAVDYAEVQRLAARLHPQPRVIALDPHTLGEMLGDVRTLAEATGTRDAGVALVADAAQRIDAVRLATRRAERPRVAALEWFDPPYAAGHWTPQMIDYAGGIDVLGLPGEESAQTQWQQIAAMAPEIVVAMPCGYDAETARLEALAQADRLTALGARRLVAVDASAYFSRPGPRLIEGLELLAHVLHPELVPETPVAPVEIELELGSRSG